MDLFVLSVNDRYQMHNFFRSVTWTGVGYRDVPLFISLYSPQTRLCLAINICGIISGSENWVFWSMCFSLSSSQLGDNKTKIEWFTSNSFFHWPWAISIGVGKPRGMFKVVAYKIQFPWFVICKVCGLQIV